MEEALSSPLVSNRKGLNRSALLAAISVTLVVLLAERLGGIERMEGASLDARFKLARSSPRPLSDRISLVAVDDSSIETIGRWPWPRDLQAKGIDEIRRAGAAVVAFDILYDAPSFARDESGAYTADGTSMEDVALAEAIRLCEGVVGANSDPSDFLDGAWIEAESDSELGRLLEVLGSSVILTDDEVVRTASLDSEWEARYREQPNRFRELAAWLRLRMLRSGGSPVEPFDSFLRAVGVAEGYEGSPGYEAAWRAWQRIAAWNALARWMPPATGAASPKETPPIPIIAQAAGGVGMVFGEPDADDRMRRISPMITTPGGDCPQMGIAAAARFLGVDPRTIAFETSWVTVGSQRIPRLEGMVVIDWPTAMFTDRGVLRGGGERRPAIPFGTLVNLAEVRDASARNEDLWLEVSQEVAMRLGVPIEQVRTLPLPAETHATLFESIDFMLDGAPTEDDGSDQARLAKVLRAYRELVDLLPEQRRDLSEAEAAMKRDLQGCIVFVGFAATAVAADMINTPFGFRTPGVYVHAAVADMVLGGHGLRFPPIWSEPAATLLLGVLCAFIAARLSAGIGALTALAALALYGGSAWLLFDRASLVLPMAGPLLGGFASWVAGVTFVAVISQRERAKIIRQFRARVSSELVGLLTGNPNALSVGGAEREITVLFGDLAGFTTLSEKLGGPQVVFTLNRYMGALTRGLTARRAYVNKFLGDGLLAFWSAFGNEPDQCRLAVESAHACQLEVTAIGETPEFRDRPRIRLRLGIATGKAVVGDCGAPPELNDYTAIGDVVNLASRLESANKQFGTSVLIDAATARGAGEAARGSLLRLGRVVVVGQSIPVEVFALVEDAFPTEARRAVEAAVDAFAAGDRAHAVAAWEAAAALGAASIAKPFQSALEHLDEPLDGVLRLRAK